MMTEERPQHYVDVVSPFCENCKEECPSYGCREWREYYKKNWDQNISKAAQRVPRGKQVFRYEHPDMIREGIILQGNAPAREAYPKKEKHTSEEPKPKPEPEELVIDLGEDPNGRPEKICDFCGKVYSATRINQRFCGQNCKTDYETNKMREYYKKRRIEDRKKNPRICIVCGGPIDPEAHGCKRTCSQECWIERRRQTDRERVSGRKRKKGE